jgi:hypothetical protein
VDDGVAIAVDGDDGVANRSSLSPNRSDNNNDGDRVADNRSLPNTNCCVDHAPVN